MRKNLLKFSLLTGCLLLGSTSNAQSPEANSIGTSSGSAIHNESQDEIKITANITRLSYGSGEFSNENHGITTYSTTVNHGDNHTIKFNLDIGKHFHVETHIHAIIVDGWRYMSEEELEKIKSTRTRLDGPASALYSGYPKFEYTMVLENITRSKSFEIIVAKPFSWVDLAISGQGRIEPTPSSLPHTQLNRYIVPAYHNHIFDGGMLISIVPDEGHRLADVIYDNNSVMDSVKRNPQTNTLEYKIPSSLPHYSVKNVKIIFENAVERKTFLDYCLDPNASKEIKTTVYAITHSPGIDTDDCYEAQELINNRHSLMIGGRDIKDLRPLASLTHLTALDLGQNYIEDITPLASLRNLEVLDLSYNMLIDISPLSALKKLTFLSLRKNMVNNVTPLASLTNLNNLSLGYNNITDISPLDSLGMYNITGIFPLENLEERRILDVEKNPLGTTIQNLQWRSESIEIGSHGQVTNTQGVRASVRFYESANNGGVNYGVPLDVYNHDKHPEAFNQLEKWFTTYLDGSPSLYPYAGKSSIKRNSGRYNYQNLQMHPPQTKHLIVAEFTAPFSGDYRVIRPGIHRVSNKGGSVAFKIFGKNKEMLFTTVDNSSREWTYGDLYVPVEFYNAGEKIYFALDNLDGFDYDATEVSFVIEKM